MPPRALHPGLYRVVEDRAAPVETVLGDADPLTADVEPLVHHARLPGVEREPLSSPGNDPPRERIGVREDVLRLVYLDPFRSVVYSVGRTCVFEGHVRENKPKLLTRRTPHDAP